MAFKLVHKFPMRKAIILGTCTAIGCSPVALQREACLAKADAAFWQQVAECEAAGLGYDECEQMADAEEVQDLEYQECLAK